MKIIIYLFALLLCVQIVLAQQDSSYLPLAVGNYWEMEGTYTKEYYDPATSSTKERYMPYNLKIKIRGDTVLFNKKKYFILDHHGEISDTVLKVENYSEYLRKDSIGDVYKYLDSDSTDYLLWKFSGIVGELYYNKLYADACIIGLKDSIQIIFTTGYFSETKSFSFVKRLGYYKFGYAHRYYVNYKKVIINGICITCDPIVNIETPKKITNMVTLHQNYPNPFNPETNISYSIPERGIVKLTVYDLLGREVKTLFSGNQTMGTYTTSFNATGLSSGLYFVELSFNSQDNKIKTKLYNKILLTK